MTRVQFGYYFKFNTCNRIIFNVPVTAGHIDKVTVISYEGSAVNEYALHMLLIFSCCSWDNFLVLSYADLRKYKLWAQLIPIFLTDFAALCYFKEFEVFWCKDMLIIIMKN